MIRGKITVPNALVRLPDQGRDLHPIKGNSRLWTLGLEPRDEFRVICQIGGQDLDLAGGDLGLSAEDMGRQEIADEYFKKEKRYSRICRSFSIRCSRKRMVSSCMLFFISSLSGS